MRIIYIILPEYWSETLNIVFILSLLLKDGIIDIIIETRYYYYCNKFCLLQSLSQIWANRNYKQKTKTHFGEYFSSCEFYICTVACGSTIIVNYLISPSHFCRHKVTCLDKQRWRIQPKLKKALMSKTLQTSTNVHKCSCIIDRCETNFPILDSAVPLYKLSLCWRFKIYLVYPPFTFCSSFPPAIGFASIFLLSKSNCHVYENNSALDWGVFARSCVRERWASVSVRIDVQGRE